MSLHIVSLAVPPSALGGLIRFTEQYQLRILQNIALPDSQGLSTFFTPEERADLESCGLFRDNDLAGLSVLGAWQLFEGRPALFARVAQYLLQGQQEFVLGGAADVVRGYRYHLNGNNLGELAQYLSEPFRTQLGNAGIVCLYLLQAAPLERLVTICDESARAALVQARNYQN